MMKAIKSAGFTRGLTIPLLALLISFLVAACNDLLSVDNPAAVTQDFLEDPANGKLVVAGAIADFECAFANYIVAGALIGNEMWDSQGNGSLWGYDQRSFDETGGMFATSTCGDITSIAFYQALSTARHQADFAAQVLSDATDAGVPDRAELLATAHAYAGYGRLLLGEGMCSAAIDGGPEQTPQQMFALAEEEFTAALTGGNAEITNMARVGRARARLNQENTAGALADAQEVSEGFVRHATYGSESYRSSNKVYLFNNLFALTSVEDDYHDLLWKGIPDPRVPVVDVNMLSPRDNRTPYWTQGKYADRSAPIPIARYEEAQLIIAEIEGGQTAVDIINALHAAAGLPDYDPATDGPIMEQIIEERERELFLESHHLYDMIRFNKPLHPAPGAPFQETGPKGGVYGTTVCLPLPLAEKYNNPNIP